MGKYAMTVSCTETYMPGVNAILNAREIYGIDADVHVYTLGGFLGDEYKNQWENVYFHDIDTGWHPPRIKANPEKHWYFHLTVGMFNNIRNQLLPEYRVVLYLGADVCVCNDLTDWFKVADKLDTVVTGVVRTGPVDFRSMSPKWPYLPTWEVPYNDVPLFIPNTRMNLLDRMLSYFNNTDCRLRAMDSLNYAIRDEGEPIFRNPDQVFFMKTIDKQKYQFVIIDGKPYLCCGPWRFGVFHHRSWNKTRMHHMYKEFAKTDVGRVNSMLTNTMFLHLNTKCRVKWEHEVEPWTKKDLREWENTHL